IMDVVLIDGYTQGGMNGAGRPWVELNGNGLAGSGLVTLVGGVTMRGLAINRFGIDGIFLGNGPNTPGNIVQSCYIGTDLTGTNWVGLGNGRNGITILGPNNLIGGTGPGTQNLISGNVGAGIALGVAGAPGVAAVLNQITNNFIGTDITGRIAFPNA